MNKNVPEIRFEGFSGPWEQKLLFEVSEKISVGIATSSSKHFVSFLTGVPFIKNQDIKNSYIDTKNLQAISHDFDKANKTKRLQTGDILTVRTGYPGLSAVLPSSLNNAQSFTTLITRVKRKEVSPFFVSTYINSDSGKQQMNGMQAGGAQQNINANTLKNFAIYYPNLLDEQIAIGNTFQKLDSLINQHQQKHDKLSSIKKAMLEKMFPKQGETIPEIRFKGFSGEWEEVTLGEYARFTKGQGYSKSDLSESGTPIILYGRLYTNYQTVISQVDTFAIEKSKSLKSVGNEVIVPASGESSEDIARASAVCESGVILGGDLNIIYPNDKINPVFLALVISNGYPQKELASKAQGKSVVHIRNSDLVALLFTMPKKEEQTVIGNYFQKLDSLINQHQQQITKLNNIKQACLSKMFV
mgnify:FL=1